MACKDHWDSMLQRLVLHPMLSPSLIHHVAQEMQHELAAAMLRHNCWHFSKTVPSLQFSNLAAYQNHLGNFDKLLWSGCHPSHSDSSGVGCNLEGSSFKRSPGDSKLQLHLGRTLPPASASVTQCLLVKATSGQQYSCCVARRGTILRGCLSTT